MKTEKEDEVETGTVSRYLNALFPAAVLVRNGDAPVLHDLTGTFFIISCS